MSDEGDPRTPRDAIEDRLDQAFGSMRPRPAFEEELLDRIRRAEVPEPVAGVERHWWSWAGAVAAVLVVGLLGYLALSSGHEGTAPTSGSGSARNAAPAERTAAFGKLPRPPASAAPMDGGRVASGFAGAQAPAAAATSLMPGGEAPVIRYREPAPSDNATLAAALGASGEGARYAGRDFTLVFYPTNAALGQPAHYVLTPAGPAPSGSPPGEAAARAAADAFLAARGLGAGAGTPAGVTSEGPLAIVHYTGGAAVYVRGDGGVFQAAVPTGTQVEQSNYPLAPLEQLRAAAHAAAGAQPRFTTVVAFDGQYGYLEPAAAFGSVVVPAVDPSRLR